jgi:Fe-S oxidoreductase
MATYKAEFLHQHYRGRTRPASHYSMGWLPLWLRATAAVPGLGQAFNTLTAAGSPLAATAKRVGGIDAERTLPTLAPEPLTRWFRCRPNRSGAAPRGRVLLWPDTFTNSFTPRAGQAAVEVLEAAGFAVVLPERPVCCGLTWLSTGQLGTARRVLRRTLSVLGPDLDAGTPVVGLEPSCTAVFRSDLAELLPGDHRARRLAAATHTLAELLTQHAPDWAPPRPSPRSALMQVHCHQHAVLGNDPDTRLLDRAGITATVPDSGCCGMAGAFGYEADHFEISMRMAELSLLPAVRRAGAYGTRSTRAPTAAQTWP